MKASDLRIGNIVVTKLGISEVFEVSENHCFIAPIWDKGNGHYAGFKDIKPLPINTMNLVRLGFEVDYHIDEYNGQKYRDVSMEKDDFYFIAYTDLENPTEVVEVELSHGTTDCLVTLNSIHEIQNAYYTFFKSELKYETTK